MVGNVVSWVFHAISVTWYCGTVVWCGIVGHRPIPGAARCHRCFERCGAVS